MSTGAKMTTRRILLICGQPELHYDSLLRKTGFDVVSSKTLEDGMSQWRPSSFNLVLIVVDGDLERPLAFCEGVKKVDPTQNVAFVAGWHTYVPPLSCPDEVIQQDYNPARFLKKVTELSQAS